MSSIYLGSYDCYHGTAKWDESADRYRGAVQLGRDLIEFEGATPAEARAAFMTAVEEYIERCSQAYVQNHMSNWPPKPAY